jgi:glucokinase
MSEFIVGVDLGGTRIRAALLDTDLNILARDETLTLADEGPDQVIGRMAAVAQAVMPGQGRVIGVGVSSPGPLNPHTGVVLAPPNLPGWHNVPLAQRLRDALGYPVFIGNDANVAVLAEAARGAARGCQHAIYLTLSTGIGGGVLVDGRLLLGQEGFAAEVGHILMVVNDRVSSLEKEAAGPALARQARALIEQGRDSLLSELVQGDLSHIDSALIGQAAQQGDALAREIVERAGRIIGIGIVSLLHLFNPQVIVIGGGVSNLGDLLFVPMRAAVEAHVIDKGYLEGLRIERSALGDNVSLIGAAALVQAS